MTRFLVKLVRYWYLYLIPLLLIPTAATVYGQRKVTTYESYATIYVQTNTFLKDLQPQDENAFATKAENVAANMGQLLNSTTFLVSVANDTSLSRLYDLKTQAGQNAAVARIAGDITVSANNTRNIVFVTGADRTSGVVAQELGTAVIKEFIAFYATKELDTLKAAHDVYTKRLDDITSKVTKDSVDKDTYARQHPEVSTVIGANDAKWQALSSQLETDVQAQGTIRTSVRAVEEAMAAASSGTSYDVKPLDAPTLPTKPITNLSKLVVYPVGALVAVLALLAIIAAIQTKLDRKIYNRQDIEGLLDRLEWDPTAVEVMPIISTSGGRGAMKWENRENSPVPALMVPVLAALPRAPRRQLRSGTTNAPRRERASAPAAPVARDTSVDDEP